MTTTMNSPPFSRRRCANAPPDTPSSASPIPEQRRSHPGPPNQRGLHLSELSELPTEPLKALMVVGVAAQRDRTLRFGTERPTALGNKLSLMFASCGDDQRQRDKNPTACPMANGVPSAHSG